MSFIIILLKNIFNFPLMAFLVGIGLAWINRAPKISENFVKTLTLYILFCIGVKGGGPLAVQFHSFETGFYSLLGGLIILGFCQPILAFYCIRRFTKVDSLTASAISASFGSVSVITFIAAISFLEQLTISYQEFLIPVLTIMEIPAIISGLFLAFFSSNQRNDSLNIKAIIIKSIFNRSIGVIFLGLLFGAFLAFLHLDTISENILILFKPLLCLFLFMMGLKVGSQKEQFQLFSWELNIFGFYMPLIGAVLGLFLSCLIQLDVGTATLVAVLTASASYIAVPAAVRIALPAAKEAIYLPLSLGITFPFNVVIGIPIYYYLANWVL